MITPRQLYYVLEGRETRAVPGPIEWATWLEKNYDKRHVADSVVGDTRVSTVFMGLDTNFWNGPPILFETMVFGGRLDQQQWRYSTFDEALAGHNRIVTLLRETQHEPK